MSMYGPGTPKQEIYDMIEDWVHRRGLIVVIGLVFSAT